MKSLTILDPLFSEMLIDGRWSPLKIPPSILNLDAQRILKKQSQILRHLLLHVVLGLIGTSRTFVSIRTNRLLRNSTTKEVP